MHLLHLHLPKSLPCLLLSIPQQHTVDPMPGTLFLPLFKSSQWRIVTILKVGQPDLCASSVTQQEAHCITHEGLLPSKLNLNVIKTLDPATCLSEKQRVEEQVKQYHEEGSSWAQSGTFCQTSDPANEQHEKERKANCYCSKETYGS